MQRGYCPWRLIYRIVGLSLGVTALVSIQRHFEASLSMQTLQAALPILARAVPWFMLPLLLTSLSWWLLFPVGARPPAGRTVLLSWIGLAINWVLPVATVGGEVVKFDLGSRMGLSRAPLAASLVVDKTTQVVTQIAFVTAGLALLAAHTGRASALDAGVRGLLIVTVAVAVFVVGQRAGMFGRALRALGRGDSDMGGAANRVDDALADIYRAHGPLLAALVSRFGFRVLFAAEVWWVLDSAGMTVEFADILILESVIQGARMSAFIVPAGIGIQEGALITVGTLLGLPLETLILLAIVKRLREVVISLPALAIWQWLDWRSARARVA